MSIITKIHARQIFDSRGIPTIEAQIFLSSGAVGRFMTPSGASCGHKEALELRDNDLSKYAGRGVSKAIANIKHEISRLITNKNFETQSELDQALINLDGTPNKSRLGANAILAVSGAFFHALADSHKQPLYAAFKQQEYVLPMPLINIINGGAHANNNLDIQEFMLVPTGAPSFSESLRMAAEIFYALKSLLKSLGLSTAVGDEGGFAPELKTNEHALELLSQAAISAGYEPGKSVYFALDIAANELYDNNYYKINNKILDRDSLLDWYNKLINNFPICSIEDPFQEDDYIAFQNITKKLGNKIQIVGDDLFVTNKKYIKLGLENNYANAVLIKLNQIGTISESLEAVKITQAAGWKTVISHRSGETEDCTIADLAVLTKSGQIKTGSMSRSERLAKYNRLLYIEEELGKKAVFINPFK